MGWLGDAWDKVKDVGSWVIAGLLGTVVHYIYILSVLAANARKPRRPLSECLINLLEDMDILSNNVDLTKVKTVENARLLAKGALTNSYTIFFKEDFDEDNNLYLLMHELKHVEQYQDLGYAEFVIKYDQQIVRHGYDNAPLENEADRFRDDHYRDVRSRYNSDCLNNTSGGNSSSEDRVTVEDWTMLLDLI